MTALKEFAVSKDFVDGKLSRVSVVAPVDLKFANLETQNLRTGGDGEKLIGGKPVTLANDANLDALDITAGTGLVWDHAGNSTQDFNGTRTGPLLRWKLSDYGVFMPDMPWMRFYVRVSAKSIATNLHRMFIGFENGQTSTSQQNWQHGQQHSGGQLQWFPAYNANGILVDSIATTVGVADEVWMAQIDSLGNAMYFRGAMVGDDFPPAHTMDVVAEMRYTAGAAFLNGFAMGDMAAYIGMDTQTASGNLTATITHARIEIPAFALREPGTIDLYNKNLALEESQDLTASGDTDYTVAEKTAYVRNSAQADSLDITKGFGLVMDHQESGGSDLFNTTRTCPIVGWRLDQFLNGKGIEDLPYLQLWCKFSGTFDTNIEFFRMGIERLEASYAGASYHNWWVGKDFRTGPGQNWRSAHTINGSTSEQGGQTDAVSGGGAHDVMVGIFDLKNGTIEMKTGASVGGEFPLIKNMERRYKTTNPLLSAQKINANELAWFFCVAATVGSANFTVTVDKIKLVTAANVVKDPVGVGGWEVVSKQEVVGSAASEMIFGVDPTKYDMLRIDYSTIHSNAPTARQIKVRPNNSTTAQGGQSGTSTAAAILLAQTDRDINSGWVEFPVSDKVLGSAVSRERTFQGQCTAADTDAPAAGTTFHLESAGIWDETGDITEVRLVKTQVGNETLVAEFDVGSIATLSGRRK